MKHEVVNLYNREPDMVNHPDHYKSGNGMEVIDVIEAFTADLKGTEAVCTGNIIKYICRWKKKNGLQDLKKAAWYLQHLIDKLEVEGEPINSSKFQIFRTIGILDSDGNTQDIFLKDWFPFVCNENERTFTVQWLDPNSNKRDKLSRTFSKPDFEYRFINEGE